MRGRRRALLWMVVAGMAVAGGAWPSPAAAGPHDGEFHAPYRAAWYGSDASTCIDDDDGVIDVQCTATGSAEATTGAGETTSAYRRTAADRGLAEHVFGSAAQQITYKVPRSATSVTATFHWAVTSARADARSTSGQASAEVGFGAQAPACGDGAGCTGGSGSQGVLWSRSVSGSPSIGGGPTPREVTFSVTARATAPGDLPRNLLWLAYAYSTAGGQPATICATPDTCRVIDHSGAAEASISATLLSVRISAA